MGEQKIKLLVTQEKFDELFSIDDWFHFGEMSNSELYEVMLKFVVDENEQPVSVEDARKMFKRVKKSEWLDYVTAFMKAINEAFVNPTSGGS